jgi:signal transduction histidine kinase
MLSGSPRSRKRRASEISPGGAPAGAGMATDIAKRPSLGQSANGRDGVTTTSPDNAPAHDEPHETADRAGWSVRRHLALFTIALLVPILLLLGFVLYRFADAERSRLEGEAAQIAQSITVAIDRDLTGLFAALDVLATSAYVERGDFEGFQAQAERALADRGIATVVYRLDGQQLANVLIPWGQPLPKSSLDLEPRLLESERPFVTNLLVGSVTGTRQFLAVRGVRISGELRYFIALSVPLARLQTLLAELDVPSQYTATIVDGRRVIMARTRSAETYVGQPVPAGLVQALERGDSTWDGVTMEGTPVFTAFRRSRLSGFEGIVGISNADLDAPVLRSMSLFGLMGAAIAALSAWLALFVGRRITRPIAALARTAAAVGRGERIEPLSTKLTEANQVGKVLVGASANLREREDDLREANGELQRFAYIVSHDLRSPLVNIMGFTTELEALRLDLFGRIEELRTKAAEAESAKDTELGQDFDEAIGFIKASISKMDRLINAILNLSRAGRREFNPERIDMDALIASIRASLATQAEAADAIITAKPLPSIVSDRLALEQIFSNLVDNALKYLRQGVPGRIEIIGRARGTTLVYEVRDNGRGIETKDVDRVFDLFRRSGVQDRPGEGIGLAHVRALVRRLGGTISLTSTPGEGSVFTVTLPRRWALHEHGKAA